MSYFPLFLDLEGRIVLIVGGGPVAARKAAVLLDYGPQVRVCAPQLVPELERRTDLELLRRPFSPDMLEGVFLAVAATNDREVNRTVARLCRQRSIPVDVADSREESTFLFPALVRRGPLTAGISTGGASPAASAWARRAIEDALPPTLGPILEWLGEMREEVKKRLPQNARREMFFRLLTAALEAGRPLTSQELEAVWAGDHPCPPEHSPL